MAEVIPDPKKIRSFRSAADFEKWLSKHHDRETELWLRVYKKDSGQPTVTTAEALDVVLCWGWIDGLRKSYDDSSFLQRYSPRKPKSIWSDINREHVARLTAAGRMTPHGQKCIDAAKADGRWAAAYAPIRSASADTTPPGLARGYRRKCARSQDVSAAQQTKPVRADIPHQQHENACGEGEEDRDAGGDAGEGRDDRTAAAGEETRNEAVELEKALRAYKRPLPLAVRPGIQ